MLWGHGEHANRPHHPPGRHRSGTRRAPADTTSGSGAADTPAAYDPVAYDPVAYDPAAPAVSAPSEHAPTSLAATPPAPAAAMPTPAEDAVTTAPFGLPVLEELPDLAATLERVASADRLLVDAVLQLCALLDDGRVEATTGSGIEHWLAATARMAGLDRRMLRRMCRLLDRLPSLAHGAAGGRVSFIQLRALTLELRQAPPGIDEPLDAWLGAPVRCATVRR